MRERGEGEEGGKGKGEEKGREGTPKGWLTPPHVPNPEKYPATPGIQWYNFRPPGVRDP